MSINNTVTATTMTVTDDAGTGGVPAAPVVVLDGATTNDTTLTFSGVATTGIGKNVFINIWMGVNGATPTLLNAAPVAVDFATRSWSFTAPAAAQDGTYTYYITDDNTTTWPAAKSSKLLPLNGGAKSYSVVLDTTPPGTMQAPAVAENTHGGINAVEASDGTLVTMQLAGVGAAAGDKVTVVWGTQTVEHILTADEIAAGLADIQVVPLAISWQGDGTFDVTTWLTDAAGNIAGPSAATSVTVDTSPPAAPDSAPVPAKNLIDATAASKVVGVAVILSGTGAVAGDHVQVTWGSQVVDVVLADTDIAAGVVTVKVKPAVISAQGEGTFDVTAAIVDAAGNPGASSVAATVTVDITAPDLTVNTSVDAGSHVTFSGTVSDAGGIKNLKIHEGGTVLGSATINPDGTWSFTTGVLDSGEHTFAVTARDVVGNVTTDTAVVPVCFLADTLIATPHGERAIATLAAGDPITLADGRSVPVKWIGRMTVPLDRFNRATGTPILIRAGALGGGLPRRDLYTSYHHAFALDGVLVIAGLLVNGSSIVQCTQWPEAQVTYYQVEVEGHELMLAEGSAAETFGEDGHNRSSFDNAGEFHALYPDAVPAMPMPLGRVVARRQMPRAVLSRIEAAAVRLGFRALARAA